MPTKKAKSTIVSYILDETVSMLNCKTATISGYNEYVGTLKNQAKKDKSNILFTLTKFNSNRVEIIHDAIEISKVPDLNAKSYIPDALTPLYDAIGQTVSSIDAAIKNKKEKPSVLIVIMTDGQENASKEYTLDKIRALIKDHEKLGWTFVYMGANQDAWAVGATFGMDKGNTLSYTPQTTGQTFATAATATRSYLRSGSVKTATFFTDPNNASTNGGE